MSQARLQTSCVQDRCVISTLSGDGSCLKDGDDRNKSGLLSAGLGLTLTYVLPAFNEPCLASGSESVTFLEEFVISFSRQSLFQRSVAKDDPKAALLKLQEAWSRASIHSLCFFPFTSFTPCLFLQGPGEMRPTLWRSLAFFCLGVMHAPCSQLPRLGWNLRVALYQ